MLCVSGSERLLCVSGSERLLCVSGSEHGLRDVGGLQRGDSCLFGEVKRTASSDRELSSFRSVNLNPESTHTLLPLGSK